MTTRKKLTDGQLLTLRFGMACVLLFAIQFFSVKKFDDEWLLWFLSIGVVGGLEGLTALLKKK